jgi:hypothetical protein
LIDSAGIVNERDQAAIFNFCSLLEKRKTSLINAKNKSEICPLPGDDILIVISKLILSFEQQAAVYEEDAKGENREELIKKATELEATKFLSQQKKGIEEEVARLKVVHKLKEAINLTNTQQLSIKKSALSDELITSEYVKRFNKELVDLGAKRIKVEMIKTKASKGHVYHQIKLKDCNASVRTAEVLSEGEFRITSLAGFLADVEGKPNNTPFVFDDPISSLDQDFEESTINRLIRLCNKRQVIVFTHRLSMLALLEEAAKKEKIEYEIVCLRSEYWGVGEPGDTPIFAKKTDRALNFLLVERLARARRAIKTGQQEYELIAKGICSDFRILLERLIENDLLADVVQRFRRSINTIGKIHKLAKITQEDCQLFDELMTKYSKYEHSQSYETPVVLPEPDEIQHDIEKVKTWLDEFSKRVAS